MNDYMSDMAAKAHPLFVEGNWEWTDIFAGNTSVPSVTRIEDMLYTLLGYVAANEAVGDHNECASGRLKVWRDGEIYRFAVIRHDVSNGDEILLELGQKATH